MNKRHIQNWNEFLNEGKKTINEDASSTGVACSTLGNTSGMGDVVAPQPSIIPGDTQGSTTGSGDIGSSLGTFTKAGKKRKRKKELTTPMTDYFNKLYNDYQND